jgi:hypothetical protein
MRSGRNKAAFKSQADVLDLEKYDQNRSLSMDSADDLTSEQLDILKGKHRKTVKIENPYLLSKVEAGKDHRKTVKALKD